MTAAEIYALSQSSKCTGPERCHYCGTKCERLYHHGEPIRIHIGSPIPSSTMRRFPSSPFICQGCWLWRRKRVSAPYLSGGIKDGVAVESMGWFVVPGMAWAISPKCGPELYKHLLKPPAVWFLALLEPGGLNTLALIEGNCQTEVTTNTSLTYTIDSKPHKYTIYELEQAGLHGEQGREPGVRELLRVLGPIPPDLLGSAAVEPPKEEGRGKGRPAPTPDPRLQDVRRPVPVAKKI